MLKLVTINLSENWGEAASYFGQIERGELSKSELAQTLERFAKLAPDMLFEAEPYLIIITENSRYIVRNLNGKLFIQDSDATRQAPVELSPDEIADHLIPHSAIWQEPRPSPSLLGTRPSKDHSFSSKMIAVGMLVVGLSLNGYTLYSAFYVDDVNQTPPLTILTSKAEIEAFCSRFAGLYVTGDEQGERAIEINEHGSLKLYQLGIRGVPLNSETYNYSIGKRDKRHYFSVPRIGLIEAISQEKLILFGDTYNKASKASPR